jgi:hypothetical protein
MERPCFIEVKCGGEMVAIDPTKIEALLPGTLRYFGPQQTQGTADLTVVHFISGYQIVIDHPMREVLRRIYIETRPETEL